MLTLAEISASSVHCSCCELKTGSTGRRADAVQYAGSYLFQFLISELYHILTEQKESRLIDGENLEEATLKLGFQGKSALNLLKQGAYLCLLRTEFANGWNPFFLEWLGATCRAIFPGFRRFV